MSDTSKKEIINKVLVESCELEGSLRIFHDINQKAQFIALSAAIEGARMRSKLATFSIVANQIADQAAKNNELSDKLESLVAKIKSQALESVSVRNLELSSDLIDKLDRNLFERNCDVQAWATFDSVKNALFDTSESAVDIACQQLEKLVTIYCVYLDSFLLDMNGKVVASAKRREKLGSQATDMEWFAPTRDGNVTVTDVHLCSLIGELAVGYCSPVLNDEGKVIGVLANFFDWKYAVEMILSGQYSENTNVMVVDSKANVIASKRAETILKDHCLWLRAGEQAIEKSVGYSLEKARNGESLAVGFSHTKGYNAYKGKGWSSIVSESIGDTPLHIFAQAVENRSNGVTPVQPGTPIESERSGQKLLATMKEIDQLVFEINANNREVKLLAVNASIQAGLAGADGEGFSIIANEVAALAKKSLSFVDQVNSTTSRLQNAVEHSSSIRLLDAARDTMDKIDRNLFERYCDIQAWSTFSKLQELLVRGGNASPDDLALLAKIHKIYEVYHDIYVINPQGKAVGTAINHSILGHDFSTKEWFRSALAGNVHVTDLYVSDVMNIPIITFSSPILGPDRNVIGVLASRFNCNFINDILRAAIIDSSSKTYLLNNGGEVIAARAQEDIFRVSYSHLPVVSQFEAGKSGSMEYIAPEDKTSHSLSYSFSKGYNTYPGQKWVLITQRPDILSKEAVKISPAERFRQRLKKNAA